MPHSKLKRRIRERMAKTGERYTVARLHVLAQMEREVRERVALGDAPPRWYREKPNQP